MSSLVWTKESKKFDLGGCDHVKRKHIKVTLNSMLADQEAVYSFDKTIDLT